MLLETWTDRKKWGKIREKLPEGYVWGVQHAKRKNRKGRAMGGLIMGMRRELVNRGKGIEEIREGVMVGRVGVKEDRWRIVGVYVNRNELEDTLGVLENWTRGDEDLKTIVEGGTLIQGLCGREGGSVEEEVEALERGEGRKRRSKDGKVNGEGRKLVEFIEERGWSIFNGDIDGDKEGEYTFTVRKGCTVIDYVIGNREVKERIRRMEIGESIESDHQPLKVTIKEKGEGWGKRTEGERLWRRVWDGEG